MKLLIISQLEDYILCNKGPETLAEILKKVGALEESQKSEDGLLDSCHRLLDESATLFNQTPQHFLRDVGRYSFEFNGIAPFEVIQQMAGSMPEFAEKFNALQFDLAEFSDSFKMVQLTVTEATMVISPPQGSLGFSDYCEAQAKVARQSARSMFPLGPDVLFRLYPYHIVLDSKCKVVQLAKPGAHISSFFKFTSPRSTPWEIEHLLRQKGSSPQLITSTGGLMLKGTFLQADTFLSLSASESPHDSYGPGSLGPGYLASSTYGGFDPPYAIFLGMPKISSLEEMSRHGLKLSYFPSFDMSSDLMLLEERHRSDVETLTEAMEAAEKEVLRLRKTLSEVLGKIQEGGAADFRFDNNPVPRAVALLNRIMIQQAEVTTDEILEVQAALVKSETHPVPFLEGPSLSGFAGVDEEVEQSLKNMLFGGVMAHYPSRLENPIHSTDSPWTVMAQSTSRRMSSIHSDSPDVPEILETAICSRIAECLAPCSQEGCATVDMAPPMRVLSDNANMTSQISKTAKSELQPQPQPPSNSFFSNILSCFSANVKEVPSIPKEQQDVSTIDTLRNISQSHDYALGRRSAPPEEGMHVRNRAELSLSSAPKRSMSVTYPLTEGDHNGQNGTGKLLLIPVGEVSNPLSNSKRMTNWEASFGSMFSQDQASGSMSDSRPVVQAVSVIKKSRRNRESGSASATEVISTNQMGRHPQKSRSRASSAIQKTPTTGSFMETRLVSTGVSAVTSMCKEPRDELSSVLANIDNWQFNTFSLEAASNGRPLSVLGYTLLSRTGLMAKYQMDETKLIRTHAADVLRNLHVICTRGGLVHTSLWSGLLDCKATINRTSPSAHFNYLTVEDPAGSHDTMKSTTERLSTSALDTGALEVLTAYLGALIHDYEHRGVNNQFLVQAGDELALMYNDISPMENHHLKAAFTLLREDQYNFLDKLPRKDYDTMRSGIIDLVLTTDMKQHFNTVASFTSKTHQLLMAQLPEAVSSISAVAAVTFARASSPISGTDSSRHTSVNASATSSFSTVPINIPRAFPHAVSSDCVPLPLAKKPSMDTNSSAAVATPSSPYAASLAPSHLSGAVSSDRDPGSFTGGSPNKDLNPISSRNPLALRAATARRIAIGTPESSERETLFSSTNDGSTASGGRVGAGSNGADSVKGGGSVFSTRASRDSALALASKGSSSTAARGSRTSDNEAMRHSTGGKIRLATLDDETRMLMWKIALKCADLGHWASPRDVHSTWVQLLEEEMFRQGDREEVADHQISPLMDRNKTGITKSQPGFFKVVVKPLFSALSTAFPMASPMLDATEDNCNMWLLDAPSHSGALPSTINQPKTKEV
eukprot:gene4146-14244_t